MDKPRFTIKEEHLYPIIILMLVWIMALRLPLDSDMWWHLRAGQDTWINQEVYRVDTYSSTRYGTEWINHSWLSQVFMFLLFRIGSFPALSLWVAGCAVISLGLVYLQQRGHPLLRGVVLLLAGVVASVVWSPRPQIFSLVLLALLGWLMHAFRKQRKLVYLVWIPPVFALWGNLHAGYALGLIYLAAVLGGELMDRILLRTGPDHLETKELAWLTGAMIASGLALLLNPFGIKIWQVPFNTIGVETLQNLIQEWASPDFHQAFQQPMLVMLLLTAAAFALSGERVSGSELVPVLVFTWAALAARRNFGPFALVAAPPLSRALAVILEDWAIAARLQWKWVDRILAGAASSKQAFNPAFRMILNWVLVTLLALACVLKTVQVNQSENFQAGEKALYPLEAVELLESLEQPIRLFNDYNWGGYLIYRLPDVPVFVDGRTDLYGDEILLDYLRILDARDGWEGMLADFGIDTMLVRSDSSLAVYSRQAGWNTLYERNGVIILGRK